MARSTIDQQIEAQRKRLEELQAQQEATRIKKVSDLNAKYSALVAKRSILEEKMADILTQVEALITTEDGYGSHPLDEVAIDEFEVDVPLPFSVVMADDGRIKAVDDTVEAKSSGTR
jgi:hypothetical protein